MRSFTQMAGGRLGSSTSSPLGSPQGGGLRAQPTVAPVPNNVPAGAQTGAPPRVQFFNRLVNPAAKGVATLIAMGTPENRSVTISTPAVGFTIYIGGESVTPQTGMALPPGQMIDLPLVGLQDLYAITDAPTYLKINVSIAIVLMAEQARPVGRIGE